MPKKEKLPKEKKPPKQAKHEKQQKKRKGRSVQDFIGVKTFTKYGLMTQKGELLFYLVSPTNISVLSYVNIEIKIRHLMMVLSSIPDIEITCTDSSECFDDNKAYLHERLEYEQNPKVRKLIKKDIEFLDNVQVEMATARQFLFTARIKASKDKQVFDTANRVEKIISEQGFEVRRMRKADIKRFLALYFEASMNGEQMPDIDGEQFYEVDEDEEDEAYQEIAILAPVRVLATSKMTLPGRTWEHLNVWDCPYKMKFDAAEVSQIIIRYDGMYRRCIRAKLTDLCYEGIKGEWRPVGSVLFGNASVIEFNSDTGSFENLLYVQEDVSDTKEQLETKLDNPDEIILDRICDEVFGDG